MISATASSVQLAGSDDDIEAKKADITLTMEKPIPSRLMPTVGTLMTFQGTVSTYTPNPFMMNMTEGILLDKNGNPLSTHAGTPYDPQIAVVEWQEIKRGSGPGRSPFSLR